MTISYEYIEDEKVTDKVRITLSVSTIVTITSNSLVWNLLYDNSINILDPQYVVLRHYINTSLL